MLGNSTESPSADSLVIDAQAMDELVSDTNPARWLTLPVWTVPTALALVLGFFGIADWSIWMDEAATILASDRSITDMARMFRTEETQLAGYYLFMHAWTAIVGTSELALRAPSALGVAAAAGLTAVIGARLYTRRVGVLAGVLLAVAPSATSLYAHDARPYGLVLMTACASALALIMVIEAPRRSRWVAYGACVMVLAFGHTLALAVLPSHAVFVALRSGKRALVRWALVAAVAISPALLVALVLTRGTYPTHYEVPDLEALINAPELVLRAAGFGWLLMGLAVTALSRRSASVFLACWLLVPPVVLYVVSHLLTPAFLGRYLLVAAPALMILAARALASSTVTMVVGVILVVALVWSPISSLRSAPSQSQDYRSVAQFISDEQTTGDAILFDHPAHREGIDYYLGSMPGPDDLAFETSAAERGRLYAGEIYPLSDASLDGVERVWVVEQPDQARREEFMEFLGGFDLDQTRNFFALKVSLYTRD